MMAHVADYLSSISFYWPIVSAQDFGRLAPLHELDAAFNNTVKHAHQIFFDLVIGDNKHPAFVDFIILPQVIKVPV